MAACAAHSCCFTSCTTESDCTLVRAAVRTPTTHTTAPRLCRNNNNNIVQAPKAVVYCLGETTASVLVKLTACELLFSGYAYLVGPVKVCDQGINIATPRTGPA